MTDIDLNNLERLIKNGITSFFTIEKILEHDVLELIKEVRMLREKVKELKG